MTVIISGELNLRCCKCKFYGICSIFWGCLQTCWHAASLLGSRQIRQQARQFYWQFVNTDAAANGCCQFPIYYLWTLYIISISITPEAGRADVVRACMFTLQHVDWDRCIEQWIFSLIASPTHKLLVYMYLFTWVWTSSVVVVRYCSRSSCKLTCTEWTQITLALWGCMVLITQKSYFNI